MFEAQLTLTMIYCDGHNQQRGGRHHMTYKSICIYGIYNRIRNKSEKTEMNRRR